MKKSNWHSRKKGQCLFLEKISSPFLQPCIWILWSCDSLGVIQNSLIQVFWAFFLSFLFSPNACAALSSENQLHCSEFFQEKSNASFNGKNDKTYFNNWRNPLGNLISWNFWDKLIWIQLYKYPSISPRSCIPRGILKECSMSSASCFCQNLKLISAISGFCYKLQCRCTGQQMLTNGLTLLHSMLGLSRGMQQADPQCLCVHWE